VLSVDILKVILAIAVPIAAIISAIQYHRILKQQVQLWKQRHDSLKQDFNKQLEKKAQDILQSKDQEIETLHKKLHFFKDDNLKLNRFIEYLHSNGRTLALFIKENVDNEVISKTQKDFRDGLENFLKQDNPKTWYFLLKDEL
jgi:hypothetical protein